MCLSRSTTRLSLITRLSLSILVAPWAATEVRRRCSVSHAPRAPMLSGTTGGHLVLLARRDAQR